MSRRQKKLLIGVIRRLVSENRELHREAGELRAAVELYRELSGTRGDLQRFQRAMEVLSRRLVAVPRELGIE